MFQWKHILACSISLFITPIKAFHSSAGSPQYSPPTQRLLWNYPLRNFFTSRFLLSPEQTKNRQLQSQFVTARIIPEVLGPHRLQIKLTLMLSFFSCSQPCVAKRWHIHSSQTQKWTHELTRFEIWQSPLHFYWTGHKMHLCNSSPFLRPHQETFPLIWSFFCVPCFTSLYMWGFRAWIFLPFYILTASCWGWVGCIAGGPSETSLLIFWISDL